MARAAHNMMEKEVDRSRKEVFGADLPYETATNRQMENLLEAWKQNKMLCPHPHCHRLESHAIMVKKVNNSRSLKDHWLHYHMRKGCELQFPCMQKNRKGEKCEKLCRYKMNLKKHLAEAHGLTKGSASNKAEQVEKQWWQIHGGVIIVDDDTDTEEFGVYKDNAEKENQGNVQKENKDRAQKGNKNNVHQENEDHKQQKTEDHGLKKYEHLTADSCIINLCLPGNCDVKVADHLQVESGSQVKSQKGFIDQYSGQEPAHTAEDLSVAPGPCPKRRKICHTEVKDSARVLNERFEKKDKNNDEVYMCLLSKAQLDLLKGLLRNVEKSVKVSDLPQEVGDCLKHACKQLALK